jgi:hypothetical protein
VSHFHVLLVEQVSHGQKNAILISEPLKALFHCHKKTKKQKNKIVFSEKAIHISEPFKALFRCHKKTKKQKRYFHR